MEISSADESMMMIDHSQLFIGHKFAHGAQGQLYHGIYKDQPVAVKVTSIPEDNKAKTAHLRRQQFHSEVSLLARLHHPNVLKFVAAGRKSAEEFCMVTEYLSEGSLRASLRKHEYKTLPLENVTKTALDIARGITFIHAQGVVHRDLKPDNILVDAEFNMKIADFGSACEEAECDKATADAPGTFRWMAPEMIRNEPYGKKADVYSFGFILWELISGTLPYEDMTPIQVAFAVLSKDLRPAIPSNCPPALKGLIEQCWSTNPHNRPEFSQVIKALERFQSPLAHDVSSSVHNPICSQELNNESLLHRNQKRGACTHQLVHPGMLSLNWQQLVL